MTPKEAARWASIRPMGRGRYIWCNGVLGWGLAFGCGMLTLGGAPTWGWPAAGLVMLLSLVGGYVFGALTWAWEETLYQRSDPDQPG